MAEKTSVPVKAEDKTLRRWDPFEHIQSLQDEITRLWGESWPLSHRALNWPAWPTSRSTTTMQAYAPRMDVFEQNGNIVIKTDLPGMKVEDVEVTIEDGDLIIKGERKAEKEVKETDYYRMERSYGSFYRRQSLPEATAPDKIQATFTDGVLEVTVPKPVEKKAEAQKIAVTSK